MYCMVWFPACQAVQPWSSEESLSVRLILSIRFMQQLDCSDPGILEICSLTNVDFCPDFFDTISASNEVYICVSNNICTK